MNFDHQLLDRHAFALLDPSMVEWLPEGVASVPVVPAKLQASAHLMPRLIALRALPAPVRDALLEMLYEAQRQGEQPPVTLLVDTGKDAQALAAWWNVLQVRTPAPGRKVWLRLHDPRVLHQLLRILDARQRARLFSQVDAFTYWLGDDWVSVRNDTPVDEAPSPAGATDWDWPRIERIGAINRALHGAGVHQAGAMMRQGALAEQLIVRAALEHGLSDQADLVEFAVRGLLTRTTFDAHPAIAALIRPGNSPDDDSRLADRLALVDESVWVQLRQPDYL